MNRQTNDQIDRLIKGKMDQMDKYTGRQKDGQMYSADVQRDRQIDGQTFREIGRGTSRQTNK